MGRPLHTASGGLVYHVLNRATARRTLFNEEQASPVVSMGSVNGGGVD